MPTRPSATPARCGTTCGPAGSRKCWTRKPPPRSVPAARRADTTYAFPYGLDDFDALHRALEADPKDGVAHGLLGCWLLDAGRTTDALAHLEKAMAHGSQDPVVWRNAALATVNTGGDPGTADRYFRPRPGTGPRRCPAGVRACRPGGVRGLPAGERIAAIEQHGPAVLDRDDLAILYANLLTDAGRAEDALALLAVPQLPALRRR